MSKFVSRSTIAVWLGVGVGLVWLVGLVLPLASQEQAKSASQAPQVQAKIEDGSSAQQDAGVQSNQPHEDLDAVLSRRSSCGGGCFG